MIVTLLWNSRPTRIRIIIDPPFRFESKARAAPGLSQFRARVLRFRNPLFKSLLERTPLVECGRGRQVLRLFGRQVFNAVQLVQQLCD